MKSPLLLFLHFFFFVGILHAQTPEGWTLRKDRDGIRVYSRHVPTSKFAEIRVQCDFKGTLSQLVAALQDVPNMKDWAFNVRTTKLLEQPSETEMVYYSDIHTPWPVDSRDVVIRMQFSQNPANRELTVLGFNDPTRMPVKPGVVRVKESTSVWHVTPLPGSRLRIDYTLRLNPGGSVQPWLVNAMLTTGPFHTFTHLREVVQLPRYRNQRFAFLRE